MMGGWNKSNCSEKLKIAKRQKKSKATVLFIALASIITAFLSAHHQDDRTDNQSTQKHKDTKITQSQALKNSQVKSKSTNASQRVIVAISQIETNKTLHIQMLPAKLRNPFTNRVFQTGVEQKISLLFTTEVGELPPPIPPLIDEDRQNLAAILISKNQISESDDEMVANCKDIVDCVKIEMKKFIKHGGDPDDFLNYYHEELMAAYQMREEALRQLEKIEDEEPSLSKDFILRVNEVFKEKGIKPLATDEDGSESAEFE